MIIGVTGPRCLYPQEKLKVLNDMNLVVGPEVQALFTGDATGVDAIAVGLAQKKRCKLMLYRKRDDLPGRTRCAERTTRMVKALAAAGGTLHGWPNKPAPPMLKPSQNWPRGAAGSGTWGAIALAIGLDVPVVLHPLIELEIPEWLKSTQLTLN